MRIILTSSLCKYTWHAFADLCLPQTLFDSPKWQLSYFPYSQHLIQSFSAYFKDNICFFTTAYILKPLKTKLKQFVRIMVVLSFCPEFLLHNFS